MYSSLTVEIRKRLREFEEMRKRLHKFEEIEIVSKAIEVTVNSKEENFCLDFAQEFGLWSLDPSSALR